MFRIAIFASGSGSNMENICRYFKRSAQVSVVLVCVNKKGAGVISRAKKLSVPVFVFSKDDFLSSSLVEKKLIDFSVDLIVLAGFLLKLPKKLLRLYPKKILNLHPSLLPKYGGKGMYGSNVHKAVIKSKEKKSGISIHFVTAEYDSGEIIFSKKL